MVNYTRYPVKPGANLEEVVRELQLNHQLGYRVCAVFNGHVLYSDTVTMNSAYLEVTGKTKAELGTGDVVVQCKERVRRIRVPAFNLVIPKGESYRLAGVCR